MTNSPMKLEPLPSPESATIVSVRATRPIAYYPPTFDKDQGEGLEPVVYIPKGTILILDLMDFTVIYDGYSIAVEDADFLIFS